MNVPKLTRSAIINGLCLLFDEPRYLEIGVSQGLTFHSVECVHKVAVDPKFRFDVEAASRANPQSVYHQVTSDRYFGAIADPEDRFDIVYLDGLHTVEQTLRDFNNALFFLAPGGVIVIDDVRPRSYASSLPDLETVAALRQALNLTEKAWMGDVYRLVFFIETFFQQISYHTVTETHGQLVAWRGRRESLAERRLEEVGRLPYESIVTGKASFRYAPFATVLKELSAATPAVGIDGSRRSTSNATLPLASGSTG